MTLFGLGGRKDHGIHLCSWVQIAKPKSLGGWGLKNPFLFNQGLAANSLWRVLMEDEIWHRVIKDKYLPYTSVATWLRSALVTQPLASQLWKSLMKSLPLITHWLIWKPGRGNSVLIGLDKILGIGNTSFLSRELLLVLKNLNIHYLYQAKAQSSWGYVIDQWKSNEELGLTGNLALEWNNYTKELISSGIQLQPGDDLLLWMGGDQSGFPSTKNVYNVLASSSAIIRPLIGEDRFGPGPWHIN
jgi:hypothetical protein